MSAMMRSVLMFNGNLGNSLWLMALGGPVGRRVSVMLNKNIYTEVRLVFLVGVVVARVLLDYACVVCGGACILLSGATNNNSAYRFS